MACEMPGRALIWFKSTVVLRGLPCYDHRTFLLAGSFSVAGPSARQSLRRDRGNGRERERGGGGRKRGGRYLHACVHARKWRKIRRRGTSFCRHWPTDRLWILNVIRSARTRREYCWSCDVARESTIDSISFYSCFWKNISSYTTY